MESTGKIKKNKHKEQLRNIDDVVMQIMRQLFENMKGAPEEEEYKQRNKPESFLDCDKTKWIQQMKIWLDCSADLPASVFRY